MDIHMKSYIYIESEKEVDGKEGLQDTYWLTCVHSSNKGAT